MINYLTLIKENFNIDCVTCSRLSIEDQQEMCKALNYVRMKFGKDIFNQLKYIKVQQVEPIIINGEIRRRGGIYRQKEHDIEINPQCFSSGYLGPFDKEIVDLTIGKFKIVFMHELGHYLFERNSLLEEILIAYIDNSEYIDEHCDIDYIQNCDTPDGKLSEIFAEIFCDFYFGNLEKEFKGNKNKLYYFMQSLCGENYGKDIY
jgi:hypothetical protein